LSDEKRNGAQSEIRLSVGVRDSGVGGLTVAREIKKVLPHARILYFADTAHVPYGERSPDEVRHYALSISRFLIERGAQILVFACNTSSALALDLARETFDVPIVGTIEPGARAGLEATKNKRIGVLATRATVESGVYSQTIKRLGARVETCEIACPQFVPLVESEKTQTRETQDAAREYLAPLLAFHADTIVLGCTHYPLLIDALRQAAPSVNFVDPACAVAAEVAGLAEKYARIPACFSGDEFFASGESEGVARWIEKLLPHSANEVQSAPVFDL